MCRPRRTSFYQTRLPKNRALCDSEKTQQFEDNYDYDDDSDDVEDILIHAGSDITARIFLQAVSIPTQ